MDAMKMMKQAMSMRKDMKRIQKDLARKTVEFSAKGVAVTAQCDMAVVSVSVDASLLDPANVNRLEKAIVNSVNGALGAAKKEASSEMAKMTGGLGGLSDMLGG